MSKISITVAGEGTMPQIREAVEHAASHSPDDVFSTVVFLQRSETGTRIWWRCSSPSPASEDPSAAHAIGGDFDAYA